MDSFGKTRVHRVARTSHDEIECGDYWIVDPSQNTSEIHIMRDSDYELTGAYDERDVSSLPRCPESVFLPLESSQNRSR